MDTYSIERFGDWKEKQIFSPSAYIAHNCATGSFTSRIGREQKWKRKTRRVQQSARNYCFSLLNALSSLLIKLPNNKGLLKTWKGIVLNNLEIYPGLPTHYLCTAYFDEVQKTIFSFFLISTWCDIGRFYARDVKVVKTNLTSETLKSSVKCVFEMHLKRSRLSRQTLNASVVFTVFILDVKVISRRL